MFEEEKKLFLHRADSSVEVGLRFDANQLLWKIKFSSVKVQMGWTKKLPSNGQINYREKWL
jgi:hypothetical protein